MSPRQAGADDVRLLVHMRMSTFFFSVFHASFRRLFGEFSIRNRFFPRLRALKVSASHLGLLPLHCQLGSVLLHPATLSTWLFFFFFPF